MFSFNEYLFFAIAYLIGSIPFGVIVAKLAGLGDLTAQGSGNIGATNMVRVGGRKLGALTFILDFLKSYMPVIIFTMYHSDNIIGTYICAIMTVLGHIYPIFNRFKGGKGVACGLGALMAVDPVVCVIVMILWVSCFLITKISSASALFAFSLMPFIFAFRNANQNLMIFSIVLSVIIFLTHFGNIKRLLNGKEKKFNI